MIEFLAGLKFPDFNHVISVVVVSPKNSVHEGELRAKVADVFAVVEIVVVSDDREGQDL